jgi:hypothetical protein
MRTSIKLLQVIGMIVVVLVPLIGCNLLVGTPAQSTVPGQSRGPGTSLTPAEKAEVFKLVKTVQVTPDEVFGDAGGAAYIHYVPATDRLVVMLGMTLHKPMELKATGQVCETVVMSYKEYTLDMQPTGKYGFLTCFLGDATTRIIGNDMVVVKGAAGPGVPGGSPWEGFRLEKYDAVTWKYLGGVDIPLVRPDEATDGPTISFINGQVVISGEYFPGGTPDGPLGRGSHHHLVSTDLKPLGRKVLLRPQFPSHCPEVSMLQEPGGDILMFASDEYAGNLVMLRLDKDWNFKEERRLRDHAFFPTGSATDGRLYYVGYTDTSKGYVDNSKQPPQGLNRNVGLAAFDANWNLLQDEVITDFANTMDSHMDAESPWVTLHGNRLYFSYQKTKIDPSTGAAIESQSYVNIYELTQGPGQ